VRPIVLFVCLCACFKAEETWDEGATPVSSNSDTGGRVDTAEPRPEDTAEPQDSGDDPDPLDDIDADSLPAGSDPCRNPVKGKVVEVTDGDTIKVETGRGVERVRLIGIDTPEIDHSGPDDECYGEESTTFLNGVLDGKTIWLTFDRECEDDYDRTLAYVHRGFEDEEFIQRLMLKGGWASTFAVNPNVTFRTLFESDESDARAAGTGLWGDCR